MSRRHLIAACIATIVFGGFLVASPHPAPGAEAPAVPTSTPVGQATPTDGEPGSPQPTGPEPGTVSPGTVNGGTPQPASGVEKKPKAKKPASNPTHVGGSGSQGGVTTGSVPIPQESARGTVSTLGQAPEDPTVNIPNVVLEEFDIPLYALRIYMAAGSMFGVPWEVLASIHYHETRFSTNLSVSSAGAIGHMQFMPATWDSYGVDADGDGWADPYNLYDSVFAAAAYLKAAGASSDIRRAVFAYNHADWYVNMVMDVAKQYEKLPDAFVNSLVELSGGIFPVRARARYHVEGSSKTASDRTRIEARSGAPVVTVARATVKRIGNHSVVLEDASGNRYSYRGLESVATSYAVRKQTKAELTKLAKQSTLIDKELKRLRTLPKPNAPATAGKPGKEHETGGTPGSNSSPTIGKPSSASGDRTIPEKYRATPIVLPGPTVAKRSRIYANPTRPRNVDRAMVNGQFDMLSEDMQSADDGWQVFKNLYPDLLEFDNDRYTTKPLKVGSELGTGTLLGRMAPDEPMGVAGHINFGIRPSGKNSPWIDPTAMLKSYQMNERQGIENFLEDDSVAGKLSAGQVLLLPYEILKQRVLGDPRISIYPCGRQDISNNLISIEVLGMMEFLAESGFSIYISSLECGHGYLTASGNVSAHSSGHATDIAMINGTSVLGNQGPGTVTDQLIGRLMTLKGRWAPNQIISLMDKGGSTMVLGDHADHVHVGYSPSGSRPAAVGKAYKSIMRPGQWDRLTARLTEVKDPIIPRRRSSWADKVSTKRPPLIR